MRPQVGGILVQKYPVYEDYLSKWRYVLKGDKRVPRKLKKRLKKIQLGHEVRIVSITKSNQGSHTITLKRI